MTESPTDDLRIRPARMDDKDAVLAFTQQTWHWGDYIADVWDSWLAHPGGGLIVGEAGGAVVAMDMLRVPRPGEGWLSGLRVHPEYRGRGIGRAFMEYQIGVARSRGLHTLRFLTLETNTPIHKNAARYGFAPQARLLYHQLERGESTTPAPPNLTPLTPAAAEAAWTGIEQGPLWAASAGCLASDYVYARFTRAWWDELVAAGQVWSAPDGGLIIFDPLTYSPPPDTAHWLGWLDPGAASNPARLATLATLAAQQAFAWGYPRIETMWPRTPELEAGLAAAGWQADGDAETLLLFALTL